MDSIKAWAALVAATSIVGTIFVAIIPSGKMKAAFSTLVALVLLCAVISPFSSGEKLDFDFPDELFDFSDYEKQYSEKSDEAAMAVAKSGFESAVKTAVTNLGYNLKKVSVKCDETLSVKSVEISISGDFNKNEVESAIENICGKAEIIFVKGEKDERET